VDLGKNFTEEDKDKVVEFLNTLATRAEFNKMTTKDIIAYFRLLNFMQGTLLPKIDAHIFEVKEVTKAPPPAKGSRSKSSKSK